MTTDYQTVQADKTFLMYWFFTHLVAFLTHKTVSMIWRQTMPRPRWRSFPFFRATNATFINWRASTSTCLSYQLKGRVHPYSAYWFFPSRFAIKRRRRRRLRDKSWTFYLKPFPEWKPPGWVVRIIVLPVLCQIKEEDKVLWFWNWIRTLE